MPPAGPSKASDPHLELPEVAQRGLLFYECFAGSAGLSAEVRALGVEAVADEASQGGTNFMDKGDLDALQAKLEKWQREGWRIALHLAPPLFYVFQGTRSWEADTVAFGQTP